MLSDCPADEEDVLSRVYAGGGIVDADRIVVEIVVLEEIDICVTTKIDSDPKITNVQVAERSVIGLRER